MAGNEEEEELDNTVLQEPQPGPGEEIRWREKAFLAMQLFSVAILYFYVVIVIFFVLVVPASITPLIHHSVNDSRGEPSTDNEVLHIAKSLLQDGVILLLFVLQHSFMPLINVEDWLRQFNMAAYSRAFYVITTCITLQVMYYFWCPLDSYYIWNFTDGSTLSYVVIVTVHVICWFSIGCSLFTVDHLELIGAKQLYYQYLGTTDPLSFKAWENHELLRHMRHPVFLSPLLILWAIPRMTYDRILVGVMLPVYLIWGSRLDSEDVLYVNNMYQRKKRFLLYDKND